MGSSSWIPENYPRLEPAGFCSPAPSRGWSRSTLRFVPGSVQPKKLSILLHWECSTPNLGDAELSACFRTSTPILCWLWDEFLLEKMNYSHCRVWFIHQHQFSPYRPFPEFLLFHIHSSLGSFIKFRAGLFGESPCTKEGAQGRGLLPSGAISVSHKHHELLQNWNSTNNVRT